MAQGTIKDYDEQVRTGTLLMDDRTVVAFDATAIEGSNIRTLRLGQRVRFELVDLDGAPTARSLRLVTFD